ncbi:L-fucose kinase-like [Dreissena polymorpha]|uniref:L-fucose kinase-like n=1 Tax=Dreissena polymorpha TaxID=45954 RepID=UPI0022641A68|nr:L-fucose kinase-like [Dreissena polymorpha]
MNILFQDVVRNWYARNPQIVETEDSLVQLANQCSEFIKKGDLESVGQCMDEYWVLKKTMAPGCEPEFVARLMTSMRPYALGMCMAGAGVGDSCMCWPVTMRHRRTSRTLYCKTKHSGGGKK